MRYLPWRRFEGPRRSASARRFAAGVSRAPAHLHAERLERRNSRGPDEKSGRQSFRGRHYLHLSISGLAAASLRHRESRAAEGEEAMWNAHRILFVVVGAIAMLGAISFAPGANDPNAAPNPYHVDEGWAKLPQGRKWGAAIGVDIDRDGKSVWVFDRCGTPDDCSGSNLAPIMKLG